MTDRNRRLASVVALFQGSTSYGEAFAARNAIMRLEGKGAQIDELGAYFASGYGDIIEITGTELWHLTVSIVTFETTWSQYAKAVFVATASGGSQGRVRDAIRACAACPVTSEATKSEIISFLEGVEDLAVELALRDIGEWTEQEAA